MSIQVVINQKGPLPIKTTFDSEGDAPVYLIVNGSVWTQSPNVMIGIQIWLDGNVVGQAQIFSNTATTHRTVVPAYIPVQLSYGQHTLALTPLPNSTVSDVNDFFTAVIHY